MTMTSVSRAALVALACGVSGAALAQTPAGPVAAAVRAPRDTQPTLLRPKSPSPPPSAVAPRGVSTRPTPASEPVVLKVPQRVGLPPDSVRPKQPTVAEPDPSRAPSVRAGGPPSRPSAAVTPTSTAPAAVRSGAPPLDATGRCKDGTWLSGDVSPTSCSKNGGLAVRLPQKSAPRRPTP